MKGMLINPETGDLMILDGALVIGDNTEQVAQCVIMAARGELKEHPLIGAEISRLINGNHDPMWSSDAKQMLQACGVPIKRVVINNNEITIE